ncbi:MAG: phosphoribosylaminoimidazolesuccinocarboxamide synthase [Chloroflexota bacterium]|nr:MAG: phosphoribosylaminoimidazolesuccinocarboxamide synthase [Chloroflexota bacterium]
MPVGEGATFVRAGKVRDLYALDPGRLLLVASDRVSAFDVVLPTPIPDKGKMLTGISRYWFAATAALVPNHFLDAPEDHELRGRAMRCRRARVLPVEVIVRGYLAGSGWASYRREGRICGLVLPPGLGESDRLPEPILTPSTKEEQGRHDQPIDFEAFAGLVGSSTLAERIREAALTLYRFGAARAEEAGLLLADTKFEFGLDEQDGELLLVDELMTPDSSRFWEAAGYVPGGPQPSFDKQYLRDWLEAAGWDHSPPGPELPAEVVAGTRSRYAAAFERLTGGSLARYLEEDVVGP